MLIKDQLSSTGNFLFRWRSYLLLGFAPLFVWSAMQGEQVEAVIGEGFGDVFEMIAILMVVIGEGIRIAAVGFAPAGTSGRNTEGQVADDLNTTGLYSVVRNPLYLGNCLMYVGLALFSQNLALAAIMVLALLPYYERIIAAEEAFLLEKFGLRYREWAEKTPAILPRLSGWVPPALAFSIRSILRREMSSIYFAIVALYLIEIGLTHWGTERETMDMGWQIVMAFATLAYVMLKYAKRRTTLLDVQGR